MKLKIRFYVLSLFLASNLLAQKNYMITWDYNDLSFKEFVSKAESWLPVRFFYKDEWVTDLRLSNYISCKTLSCVLDSLFKGISLYYLIDDSGKVVITKYYAVKILDKPSENQNNYIPQTSYTDSWKDQQTTETAYVEIGYAADRNKPGKVIVSGYVTNKDTKEPAAGVTVSVQNLSIGAITNEHGFYSLALPRGIHLIQFSFFGIKEKKINLNLNGTGLLNVEMNNTTIPLKEVVISSEKNTPIQRFEVGAVKINMASFRILPTSMGESDLLKSLILVPGVQTVGEGSAGFNVRGGSADQNLILLYGAPIYNSSHFFGFFSAINSDIIKDVTLYKGGIPSRYGGRISSVLDIESKEGNRKEFAGNAGISPITTHLMVEGPLIKDTLTYMLNGRTTYSNWILGLIKNPSIHNSRASFYDLNGTMTYNLNRNNKLNLSSYFSHDYFRFNPNTEYSYDNNIFALKWLHFFSTNFFSAFSINNSFYKYDILNQETQIEGYILSHQINTTGFKADFNWIQGRNEINFGLDLNRYSVLPGSYKPSNDSSLIIPNTINKERAIEGAMFVDDKFALTDYLSISTGIRMSSFYAFGPQKVFLYSPEFTKSNLTIADTLNFRNGKVITKYAGPELRASLNFKITDNTSIKINYNRTRQYIHLLSNSTAISPTDTWKLCDYYLKPEIGDQFALGFYKVLFRNSSEISAELYYKQIRNMIDFKGGSTLTMLENIEQDMIDLKGKAYGLELALKKKVGKVRFDLNYTYSRTFVKSIGSFRDEIINSGNWYPANYDRPNDLVITFHYFYSRRLSFSADYTYCTGRPTTYPISTYYVNDILLINYSDRNQFRLPDYSRLDVSFKVSGNLRSHKIAHPNWIFSVYNLTGKENAYSVYFEKVGNVIEGYKLSIFSRAVPSLTFSFDF
jgi:hypothetical protein